MKSYYSILGCGDYAVPAEIREAYFQQIRKVHPDKNCNAELLDDVSSEHLVTLVTKAWHVLRNPVLRERYDMWLREQHLKATRSVIGEEVQLCDLDADEPCRCGGFYDISEVDLDQIIDFALIDCAHCSLTLKVFV
ncbi:hypothetical protein QR680_011611 [Steinernema hermaphroditum]|uniref:J domain-containing protein n=1 Tax=Steinernema hermaphroditum TaxID=289476 RepID=A0AA39I0M1_9BILA|nr:hypothetical protein QR680_011611 [Steinernema hermaphroditum]